jgi:hypothetical protein
MANTTNFGWETPDDTDLVKDGAAAMRTLGSAIDTSFVDLKGGTTGQVLSKNSNTDLDFTWIAVDPLTILDAKGDLISATAADTPARLAVGTNGQYLSANSSTSTGLEWVTPTSGGMTLLSTTTMTTDTTTISSINQTYNSLFITIEGINYPTYASYDINIDSSTSGFSGITVQANESGSVSTNQTINGRISAQWSGIRITNTNNITMIQIDNYASTTGRKPVYASYGWTGWTGSAEVIRAGWTAGAWLSTSAVDSFEVVMGSTPTAGTIKIYGVK